MEVLNLVGSVIKWQSDQVHLRMSVGYKPCLETWPLLSNQIAYVIDCSKGEIVEMHGNFEGIFGYPASDFKNIFCLYDAIAREDAVAVVKYSQAGLKWIFSDKECIDGNCHLQLSYRIRNKRNKLVRVMRQGKALASQDGEITHTLCIITDLSQNDVSSVVSVKAFGPTAHIFDAQVPELRSFGNQFSVREMEILRLVARAKTSPQIADQLFISRHTVDTHRRNMIRKLEVSNSMELINTARDMGLF